MPDTTTRIRALNDRLRTTFRGGRVLITDGINSYVIYNYGQITWTYGSASGGIDAQVKSNSVTN